MAEEDPQKNEQSPAPGEGEESEGTGEQKDKKKPEPVIHVMPQEFHAASGKRVALSEPKDRKKEEAKKGAEPGAEAPARRRGGKGKAILLIVLAVLVLGGGGFGAYYFLYMRPAPTPPVNQAPTGPVCGDGVCEGTENETNCAADCRPVAECGDNICQAEAGETKQTCPQDCGEPEPVCGDGKCEEDKGEDYQNCSDDCEPPAPTPAADIDSDGLSDIEENSIYGTNPYSPDSDDDSFVDLNELLNLFNPAQPQPSILPDNPNVVAYTNETAGFEILQPVGWTVSESADGTTITLSATTGESVVIRVSDNADGLGLLEWYLEANPGVSAASVEIFRTKQGYKEILSDDQLTSYVEVDSKIYTVSYELNQQLLIRYKATFKMIISSLKEL